MSENRVALGCLSCYNEGRLTFKWLNADELEEAHGMTNPKVTGDINYHMVDHQMSSDSMMAMEQSNTDTTIGLMVQVVTLEVTNTSSWKNSLRVSLG